MCWRDIIPGPQSRLFTKNNTSEMNNEQAAADAEADYRELVRVVTYAIEDVPTIHDKYFVHDNVRRRHLIRRGGETFNFNKEHYSNVFPTWIGFELWVNQSGTLKAFPIWVTHPQADTSVNRRATIAALERLIRHRNLKHYERDAREYLEA